MMKDCLEWGLDITNHDKESIPGNQTENLDIDALELIQIQWDAMIDQRKSLFSQTMRIVANY